ncbi:MAG TPA: CopG family transcriptional regulator [Thermoplasmata archaeon]|nr:CopG family transcriptional regulator [Thermoplasmata archaeon]
MTGAGEAAPRGGRTVHLPEDVVRGLEARRRGSSFPDLDAYVAFILARLLDEPSNEPFSEADERRLRERLRSLGYID